MGRFTTGLVIVALSLPLTARATTAPSLSQRIVIDGVLNEYASDEWVLDATSPFSERDDDSGWGNANDISRLALTWDREFLYLAVEGHTFDTFFAMFVSNRAGGLFSLEDAGAFRRAISLPEIPINLLALASPERIPDVARADDSHPFGLVDRGAVPAATSGVRGGPVGFEMAVPWSMLSIAEPVRLVAAITGDAGTGAGDAAPDASVAASDDRFARAVLDRRIVVHADIDGDGLADSGIAPRAAVEIEGGTLTASVRTDLELEIGVAPRSFAPDRGESTAFALRTDASGPVFVSGAIYSLDGDRVRTLFEEEMRAQQNGTLAAGPNDAWDGTDTGGRIVRGGAYVFVVDWGLARGEHAGRATAAVVVVR